MARRGGRLEYCGVPAPLLLCAEKALGNAGGSQTGVLNEASVNHIPGNP